MTLKRKITWGLGFLFLIILILVGFCSYYVEKLGQESDNILKDNYTSIVYSRNMLSALDDMGTSLGSNMHMTSNSVRMSDYYRKLFESGRNVFEANLKAENNNITEIHEKEYVETLNHDYGVYLKLCLQIQSGAGGTSRYLNDLLPADAKVKQTINEIYDLNMQAVERKNQQVKQDTAKFITSMSIIGSLCLLLALGYFWYFPVYISTTLSYLADRMKDLLKDLGLTLDMKTNDEAYIILQAIDLLESKLGVKRVDQSKVVFPRFNRR